MRIVGKERSRPVTPVAVKKRLNTVPGLDTNVYVGLVGRMRQPQLPTQKVGKEGINNEIPDKQ